MPPILVENIIHIFQDESPKSTNKKQTKGKPSININTFQNPQCVQRVNNEEVATPIICCTNYILYVIRPRFCLLAVNYKFE